MESTEENSDDHESHHAHHKKRAHKKQQKIHDEQKEEKKIEDPNAAVGIEEQMPSDSVMRQLKAFASQKLTSMSNQKKLEKIVAADAQEPSTGENRPAVLLTGAHHARELISMQMAVYQVLKLLHGAFVEQDQGMRNLLAQNKYYVVPCVNPDGVNLVEQNWQKDHTVLKKRKNMSPNAVRSSKQNFTCLPEDSGVDLNRNYGIDFGVGEKTQVGLGEDNMYDPCADECGECYRGPAPFSEPETRAMRDFLTANKNEIKFVSNFHSYGNMWIWPFNGKVENPIE